MEGLHQELPSFYLKVTTIAMPVCTPLCTPKRWYYL